MLPITTASNGCWFALLLALPLVSNDVFIDTAAAQSIPIPAPTLTPYWSVPILELLPPSQLVPKSEAPTIAPTEPTPVAIPTVAPVPRPVDVTPVPTTSPTASAPMVVPTTIPPTTTAPVPTTTTLAPTPPITTPPTTIAPITIVPTTRTPTTIPPTIANVTSIMETIENIYLVYNDIAQDGFSNNTIENITIIQTIMFLDFFENAIDIQNMTTIINITESGHVHDTNDTYILYDQTLMYEQVSVEALSPENYTLLPFTNEPAVEQYIANLKEFIPDVFSNLSSITTPEIGGMPPAVPTEAPTKPGNTGRLPDVWIAVIILASLGAAAIIFYAGVEIAKRPAPKGYTSPYEPTVIKSSVGGDNMDGASSSGITKSIVSPPPIEKGLFVVYAPTGKLGFSLDQPDSGPLIIYVVKDDSPLLNLIQNGDRLISVDELNVRKSSPARVVGLLKERAANAYRKLTFIRQDETQTVNDVEGQYVVYAPPEKLGFSLEKAEDEDIPPTVRVIKATSIFLDTVEVGDQLIAIDEVDTRKLSAQESVSILKDRSTNPVRKLTFVRIIPTESPYQEDGTIPINEEYEDDGLVIAFAPSGGLGFSLESPDSATMVVHNIKPTSPLLKQVKVGDRLIGVDDVDVRNLSPTRVVNLLGTRKANQWRKLTLLRRGSNVTVSDASIQLDSGIIVIYVPATKLGFSLCTPDDNGAPEFQVIKEESLLHDTIQVGDRLLRIDELDTTTMHSGKVVKILNARRENPYRRLVIQRNGQNGLSSSSSAAPIAVASAVSSVGTTGETYTVEAPAGKLGVILDNPDDGAPVIHTVKDTSPLLGQVSVGDRLIKIDDVDVSAFSPAQVVQLLSTKSSNPIRLLTMLREPVGSTEAEINLNDGESTVTGGEYIEETDGDTAADDDEK